MIVGGDKLPYIGELTTRLADLITSKVVWNSTISTRGAKYACVDIKIFYLNTPIDRYEYMKMPIELFPQYIIDQYNLIEHVPTDLCT